MPTDPTPSVPAPNGDAEPKALAAEEEAERLDTQDVEVVPESEGEGGPPPVPATGRPVAPAPPGKGVAKSRFKAARSAPRSPARAALPPLPGVDSAEDEGHDPLIEQARELMRVCEAELAERPGPARAARLHYEIGRVHERPLGDLVLAASHYQEALSLLPDHLPSIRGARRVLLLRKNYPSALELFDAEARLWSDPAKRAAIFVAKGELLQGVLNRPAETRSAFEQALALAPGDPSVLKALERWDTETGDWEALARTWEQAANATGGDVRHRAALIAQRARLFETEAGQVNAATDLYQAALDLDPGAPGALDALKRLYREQQRWHELVAVLTVEAEQTSDTAVASMALYRIGHLRAERMGQVDEAIAALEQACTLRPEDPLPLVELTVLYESGQRWQELATTLERLAATTDERDTQVDLMHRLGQTYELNLGDDEAAARWYERVLSLDPLFVPALRALTAQYAARGDWTAVIEMNLAEAEETHDTARKTACHRRVAEILEVELGQPERAAEHFAKALGYAPGDEHCIKALGRLYAEAGEFSRLVELYERALDEPLTKPQAIAWLFKLGTTYEDILRQPAQAAGAYRRVLTLDPEHLGAIQALQRACERAGRHRELVEAIELEALWTSDKVRTVALRHRAGQVLADHLADSEAAILSFRRVLEVDPAHLPSLSALGRIYYGEGRWEDLLDTYRRQLEVTPRGEAQVAVLHKMGELSDQRLGREAQAIGFYRRAITLDPSYQPCLQQLVHKYQKRREWSELVRVLELRLKSLKSAEARAQAAYRLGEVAEEQLGQTDRAIAAFVQALTEMPGYRAAFDALTRLRAGRHAWTRLLDDLEREAGRLSDPAMVIAARIRQAEILAVSLHDPARAIGRYEAVLEQQPDHLGALMALEPLYAKLGDWEALARLYARQADVLREVGPRVAALRELARVQARAELGGVAALRRTYETILELVPGDLWALMALEAQAIETGDMLLLADVAQRQAATAEDDALRSAHLVRQAEALEAARSEGAVAAYRAALAAEPDSLGAIRGLARAAEQTAEADAMVEALEREADLTRRGDLAAERLIFSARLRTSALNDEAGAVRVLERALERWPDSGEAADRLDECLRAEGRLQRLVDVLSQAAHEATDVARVADLWSRVATLFADDLDNVPGAIAALVRVLKTDPDHVPTIRQLADLSARDQQWEEACEQLSRIVTLSSNRGLLCEANLRLAQIQAEQMHDGGRAVVYLKAVLALDPNHREALARLADLSAAGGDASEAVSLARRLVSTSTNPESKARALLRLARAERSQDRPSTAGEALHEAVVLEGPTGPAAAEHESLVAETGDWDQYLDALEKHLAVASDAQLDLTPTYLALARVQAGPLGNPQAAVRTLERARSKGVDGVEMGSKLAQYLLASERPAEAVRESRRVLARDLTRSGAWLDMARALLAIDRPSEARLARSAGQVLGAEVGVDDALARSPGEGRPGNARPRSFGASVLRGLDPRGDEFESLEAMLSLLAEGLGKLLTPRLDRYGVSARDRIESADQHPLFAVAERLGRAFGVPDFHLYIHGRDDRGFGVEATEPPSLLVPANLTRLSAGQQVFLLGRPFAYLARNAHPLYRMTPQELEILLASAARTADEQFGFGLSSEEFLNQQTKRIGRALARKSRRQLEEVAERYARSRGKFSDWVDLLDRTSARASLVLADDLAGSFEILKSTEPDLRDVSLGAMVEESELARDLFEFWFSDAALELRRRAGLLPTAENAW